MEDGKEQLGNEGEATPEEARSVARTLGHWRSIRGRRRVERAIDEIGRSDLSGLSDDSVPPDELSAEEKKRIEEIGENVDKKVGLSKEPRENS